MHKDKIKKLIACALVVTMLLPAGTLMNAFAEDDTDADSTASQNQEPASKEEQKEAEDELPDKITDEQALKACKLAVKEGDISLYYDEETARVCLLDERNGQKNYWWSSPINTEADNTMLDPSARNPFMKTAQRQQLQSGIVVSYGNRESRTTSTVYSGTHTKRSSAADTTITVKDDGLSIQYSFSKEGFEIPVEYTLTDGKLTVSCDTSKIEEKKAEDEESGLVITDIQLTPYFGSVPETDANGKPVEGYMIIPDGTGAVINYNNGKGNYATVYSQKVYGRNYTNVPLQVPRTMEQAYMPLGAHVSGKKALVAIATQGDADCSINAQINGQGNQTYNSLYYDFEVRGSDDFELSGENAALKVFEKGNIKSGTLAVTYYPLANEDEVNYADVAKVYRDYLTEKTKMKSRVTQDNTNLYIDFFGGVIKAKSILGIPFDLQTEITTFEQAQKILKELKDAGAKDIVAAYNDWTSKSIDRKISTSASASGTVGGNDDLEELIKYGNDNGVTIYPSMDNMEMESSSWGYFTFTSTAIRVSNSFSRQLKYNPAFGAESGVAPALLTPTVYTKVFDEMIESYKDEDLKNIAFGGYSSKLVSDYSSSNYSSRQTTLETIVEGYKKADQEVGSVLADQANTYILPYVDHVTNVPVYSSGFNIVDYDIPLYQMVVHGYVPYSTKAVNASSNSDETFLLALAYGSAIHYDMIYADSSELNDTDYNDLYYANYKGWVDLAANQSVAADKVLSGLSKYVITNYEYDAQAKVAKTTYGTEDGEDKATVEVDLKNSTVKLDGKEIDVSNCLEEGGDEE